jgi:hypothetical protein
LDVALELVLVVALAMESEEVEEGEEEVEELEEVPFRLVLHRRLNCHFLRAEPKHALLATRPIVFAEA